MQVKKFEAPTIQEALETIKRELGPEAIILQTKKHKSGFGLMSKASVEVTAAVSDRSMQKKNYVESRLPEPTRETLRGMSADRQAKIQDKYHDRYNEKRMSAGATAESATKRLTATRYIDIDTPPMREVILPPISQATVAGKLGAPTQMSVEEEVRHLKRMIEELKNVQENHQGAAQSSVIGMQNFIDQSALNVPSLQDAFEQLVMNGVDKRYALSLIKKVAFELGDQGSSPDAVMDQLCVEIMQSAEVKSPLADVEPSLGMGPKIIALVGPTGVGKTTTVAKMASDALLRRNLKVGLINLDSYKVAAFDQLGTYAKILNIPFRSVASPEDLQAAIQDFQMLDLIIVDTTGRSQRDPASLKAMQDLLALIPNIKTHLVLAVTTRDTELYDMANRFSIFKPEGIVASKLDEATTYGAIFNLVQKVKKPLLYFTTGQRVPEDIEEATRERIAALILGL